MRKDYFKQVLLAAGLLTATTVSAVDLPYAKAPAEGKTYILVSRLKPTSFVRETSWDGSLYLQPYDLNEQQKAAFKAHHNDDGTWNFSKTIVEAPEGEEAYEYDVYMGIPSGTDNLRIQELGPVSWTVEPTSLNDYYMLKAGAGQGNPACEDGYLHLNNSGEYLVITEPGNYWFPDFYDGIQRDEYDEPLYDETGFVVPQNTISRYWAFVEIDDVPAYALKVQLYALLQNIEETLSGDAFGAGYQQTIDAVMPYYEKEDFTEADLAAAKAVIDAKQALYNEIKAAQELLGDQSDAKLSAAIEAAIAAFNTLTDTQALTDAQVTLKEAETAFALGGNDLTALGTNMSFEDLSAQGGNQTSGVAGAPAGWNVYVNGRQVVTADEVRAAGITAWHGVNIDAEGSPMDGEMAFGLWNSGVPSYEISQTISGLETGSYTITAGLMVGANNNDSRRTTQRIFGNLNSKYFASEGDYNTSLLDQGEVYGFEGLVELITDREMQPISVRAFVYDGTLTFGLRTDGNVAAANREAGNSAGGDGWFKLDNFRITKEGFIQEDALAVYRHFNNLYEKLLGEVLQRSVKTELRSVMGGNISTGSSQEEIISAIVKLREMYPTVKASVEVYKRLDEALETSVANMIKYEYSASIDDFSDLVMDAQDMYRDADAGEAEVEDMIARLTAGIEELKATAVSLGDITFVLKNPSFEDLSAQGGNPSDSSQPAPTGWTLTVDGEVVEGAPGFGWCAINRGDNIDVYDDEGNYYDHQYTDGEFLWGIWNGSIPEIELSQTLKHLPQGNYTLKADVMVEYNWAGNCLTTQRIFANNAVQMFGSESYHELNLPQDAKDAKVLTYADYTCTDGDPLTHLLRPMEVNFDVDETGIAVIGFRTNSISDMGEPQESGKGWFKLDNFRLTYNSPEVSDGIAALKQGTAATPAYYGLDGQRRTKMQRGINIVRRDGQTAKVLVK
jgi:hypothetical protein